MTVMTVMGMTVMGMTVMGMTVVRHVVAHVVHHARVVRVRSRRWECHGLGRWGDPRWLPDS